MQYNNIVNDNECIYVMWIGTYIADTRNVMVLEKIPKNDYQGSF